jgi:hypothetical protein
VFAGAPNPQIVSRINSTRGVSNDIEKIVDKEQAHNMILN